MCIHKYKSLARFGLMHMIATNICVWIRVTVRETLREVMANAPAQWNATRQQQVAAPSGGAGKNASECPSH